MEDLYLLAAFRRYEYNGALFDERPHDGLILRIASYEGLPLALPRLIRPAGVMWNKNRTLTPGARLMVACLEETAVQIQTKQERARPPAES